MAGETKNHFLYQLCNKKSFKTLLGLLKKFLQKRVDKEHFQIFSEIENRNKICFLQGRPKRYLLTRFRHVPTNVSKWVLCRYDFWSGLRLHPPTSPVPPKKTHTHNNSLFISENCHRSRGDLGVIGNS